jgi:hypothetical protein
MQEVQAGAAVVTEVATAALAALGHVSLAAAAQGLHCRALGSFCRGKAATGDIDMMIVPGDHLSHVCIRCALHACGYCRAGGGRSGMSGARMHAGRCT